MSDVLIKNMKMPTSCDECRIMVFEDTNCVPELFCGCPIVFQAHPQGVGYRPDYCPLVPVPPHGRLGDLDKLEQMFVDIDNAPYSGFDGSEPFYSAEDAAQIIRLSPTIIPADKEKTCTKK